MEFKNSIFKLVDFRDSHSLTNLKNRELLCKYFDDFNDPYEGHHGVTTKWPKNGDTLAKLISRIEPENVNEYVATKEAMSEYVKNHSNLSRYTLDKIYQTSKQFRVCSFTRRWNHILAWSHYADGCRGMALIFDQREILKPEISTEVDSKRMLDIQNVSLRWVKYVKTPSVINAVDVLEASRVGSREALERISDQMIEACVLSKYKDWRYEQETRLIALYGSDIDKRKTLYKYSEKSLKGVIFGHKCDSKNILDVAKILPVNSLIYTVDAKLSSYKLKINGAPVRAGDVASGDIELTMIDPS